MNYVRYRSPQQFKDAQRKSLDSVAPGFQERWKTFENAAQTVSDRLVEITKINPNSRVLDIATRRHSQICNSVSLTRL
jgi:hypothetical protein